MNEINQLIEALSSARFDRAIELIEAMSHTERIEARALVESKGLPLIRNLYYDYKQQCWIK